MRLRKILDWNPLTRTKDIFHEDVGGREAIIETRQDVTDIVERNKAMRNMLGKGKQYKGDGFFLGASIPTVIWHDLQRRGITRDKAALRRWLRDPDNAAWVTRPGAF